MASTFSLHELVAGVWAAVAPGTASPAVSNAAIVDLGDKTLVVDTFMTMRAAAELAEEAKNLTGKDATFVLNTHWHSDHVRGNGAFASTPIIGTRRMNELIVADGPGDRDEFGRRAAAMQERAERLAASAATPDERQRAAGTQALAEALAAEADDYVLTLPDVLITDRLEIEGERSATILSYGRGHTEVDLFVHLPDDDVLVAGDLVWIGMHPKTDDGFPAEWAGVLDRIAGLGAKWVVSGHGPPGTAADTAAMADYLRHIAHLVDAVRSGELVPDAAEPPGGTADWQEVGRFRAGLRTLAAKA